MSSNNDEIQGAAFAGALIVVVIGFIAAFVFAVLAFIALVMTVIALCAWNDGLTIGDTTITPDEARGFVFRGICGGVLLPVFAAFSSALLGFRIEEDWYGYLMIAGYSIGSVVVGYELEQEAEQARAQAEFHAQQYLPPPSPPVYLPPAPPEPFTFANWDDENELR